MINQIPLKYSQNLIKDSNLVETLVSFADLEKDDTVLEIGAGKGIITKVLAKKVAKVIAVEKDKNLFDKAKLALDNSRNVELKNEDFLNFKLPKTAYKVFANIPFSITLEITKKLFEEADRPLDAYLFMQKETGNKFVGAPYYNESLSSLLYKPLYNIKTIYSFRKEDFEPVPSKDVCLMEFRMKETFDIAPQNYMLYRDFVTYGVNRWKPNIKTALKGTFSNLQLKILSSNLKFSLDAKPTELDYSMWLDLYKEFIKIVPVYKQNIVKGSFIKLNLSQLNMRKSNLNNLEENKEHHNNYNDRSSNQRPYMAKNHRR